MHPQLSKTAEQVATYSKTISIGNPTPYGEMAEWSNAPVLKTGVLRGTGGSNPSLSAKISVTSCKTTSCADFSFKGAPNLRQNFSVSRKRIRDATLHTFIYHYIFAAKSKSLII